MRVTITSVVDPRSGRVAFQTELGMGVGEWVGELPSIGECRDVEFTVDEPVASGRTLVAVQPQDRPFITHTAEGVTLIGLLERNEADGVAVIRLGSSLLMVEFDGDAVSAPSWVQTGPVRIRLYDTNA